MENIVNEPILKYKISPEQYLREEDASLEKHEYFQGEVFAMSGASFKHNKICVSLIVALKNKLKTKKCEPFGSDLRLHIPENSLYTYPDVTVYCGDVELTGQPFETAMNPVVVIEVLSKSTKNYDRGNKFALYRQIKILTDYILVDSESVLVEHHTKKGDGIWQLREYKKLSDNFKIEASMFLLSMLKFMKASIFNPNILLCLNTVFFILPDVFRRP